MVPFEKREAAIKTLRLDGLEPSSLRVVCFYDTPGRDLLNHTPQIILRSRYGTSGKTAPDVMVKIRGATPLIPGAKREFDQVIGKDRVESWTLMNLRPGIEQIREANRGIAIKKLFDPAQQKLLSESLGSLDWNQLIPFGPVSRVKTWNLSSVAGLKTVTVERWELPRLAGKPERVLFEVSTKVRVKDSAAALKALSRALGFDLVPGEDSDTKTRLVLDHFSN